jgi:hypothetical protein
MFFFFQSRSLAEPLATSRGTPVEKPCSTSTAQMDLPKVNSGLVEIRTLILLEIVPLIDEDREERIFIKCILIKQVVVI